MCQSILVGCMVFMGQLELDHAAVHRRHQVRQELARRTWAALEESDRLSARRQQVYAMPDGLERQRRLAEVMSDGRRYKEFLEENKRLIDRIDKYPVHKLKKRSST